MADAKKKFWGKYITITTLNVIAAIIMGLALWVVARRKPDFIYQVLVGATPQAFWLCLIVFMLGLILNLQSSLDKEKRERKEAEELEALEKGGN